MWETRPLGPPQRSSLRCDPGGKSPEHFRTPVQYSVKVAINPINVHPQVERRGLTNDQYRSELPIALVSYNNDKNYVIT